MTGSWVFLSLLQQRECSYEALKIIFLQNVTALSGNLFF